MTKDEMVRYYANKIVEDGIKDTLEYSNVININNYADIAKYKEEILECIYKDERVAAVYLTPEGNFDMVFYFDYCPYYYDTENIMEHRYLMDSLEEIDMLHRFARYYERTYLIYNMYIRVMELVDRFAEEQTNNLDKINLIKDIIKMKLHEKGFLEKYIDGIEVYITPKNYKELEQVIEECTQDSEQEEME